MEGLKCPVCNAISLVDFITDGEIYPCSYCKSKFTVTAVRRLYLNLIGKLKVINKLIIMMNLLKI